MCVYANDIDKNCYRFLKLHINGRSWIRVNVIESSFAGLKFKYQSEVCLVKASVYELCILIKLKTFKFLDKNIIMF